MLIEHKKKGDGARLSFWNACLLLSLVYINRVDWKDDSSTIRENLNTKQFALAFVFVLALSQLSKKVEACRCAAPSTVRSSYAKAEKIILGKAISKTICHPGKKGCPPARAKDEMVVNATIKVNRSFKGCVPEESTITVSTFLPTGRCRINEVLELDSVLYLNIFQENEVQACSYNRKAAELAESDWTFLNNRDKFCGDKSARCNDGRPFTPKCPAFPCDVEEPPWEEARICGFNICTCTAEWFAQDETVPVCDPGPTYVPYPLRY